jgi:H+/Cl- antiporter ClcA
MITKLKTFITVLFIWIGTGLIIGASVGTLTSILLKSNDFLGDIRSDNSWLIFLLPLGGIVIGFIYMKYGKTMSIDSAKGNNTIIEGIQGKVGVLKRTGPLVYLGTFLTILLGGSTGREGAAIQMGGSVAQAVNKIFKVRPLDTKIYLMSGVSAGFGAAFGTPISGAIFGMEMAVLGKLKLEALIPCVVSSFAGHYVAEGLWSVKHEKFIVKSVPEPTVSAFALVILAAIAFGLTALLYCQLRHGIQKFSEKHLKNNHMKRAFLGGLVIIVLMLLIGTKDYNGRSLELLEKCFLVSVAFYAFLAKLIFTAVTMGSGFVGGEAIPLFVIGAALGNTLSTFIDLPMSFLAALGLIAVFCGGANTPLAAFALAVEMFNGQALQYFFLVCIISYVVSGHHGLWPSQIIFQPKSRLYKLVTGDTIEDTELNKSKE